MLIPAFFFIAAFATLGAIMMTGYLLMNQEENPLDERLEVLQSAVAVNDGTVQSRGRRRIAGTSLSDRIMYLISMFPGGDDWLHETERELGGAGVRKRESVALYCIGNIAFMLSLIILLQIYVWDGDFTKKLVTLIVGFILGWLLPRQILYRMVKRYKKRLAEALPDTVDLLGIVLGTGLALDQAMLRVSEEMQHIYPELAAEFYTVVMQVKAGQERAKAFNQLVKRSGIEDIKSLASMIIQSERFGTSLSQALKVYADTLRTRRRLRAEAAIGKAGIKMLIPIVIFILPALFVVTLVPALIMAFSNLRGGLGGH